METRDAQLAIKVFERGIVKTEREMQALETVQSVLRTFVEELEKLLPAPLAQGV